MEILGIDVTQLSYGALFVWLLLDTNKKNERREEKYQKTIDVLAENASSVLEIKEDIIEIKTMMKEVKKDE